MWPASFAASLMPYTLRRHVNSWDRVCPERVKRQYGSQAVLFNKCSFTLAEGMVVAAQVLNLRLYHRLEIMARWFTWRDR